MGPKPQTSTSTAKIKLENIGKISQKEIMTGGENSYTATSLTGVLSPANRIGNISTQNTSAHIGIPTMLSPIVSPKSGF